MFRPLYKPRPRILKARPKFLPGAASTNVTLALTGVSATGAVGNLTANVSYALTGNQATGSVGTLKANVSYGVTGVAGTGSPGALVGNVTYGLTGNAATGAVGNLSAAGAGTAALTGVAGTAQVGTLTANVTYALTGVSAAGSVGTLSNAVSYSLAGNQAAGAVGTVSAATTGDVTIALTGVSAVGQVGSLSASGGDSSGGGYSDDKSRRSNRWLVQIGKQIHSVSSLAEAQALMDKADAESRQVEAEAIAQPAKTRRIPKAKLLQPPKPVEKERANTPNAEIIAKLLSERIASYNATMQAVAGRLAELDEEDDLLTLL